MQEESLKCPNCGGNDFTQPTMYDVIENVYFVRENDKIMIISTGIENIDTEKIEYLNEFICKVCRTKLSITKYEGKESLTILE